MAPRETLLAKSRDVQLERAAGLICAEAVCPYPPGIPVLVPGEEIDEAAIAHLEVVLGRSGWVRVLDL